MQFKRAFIILITVILICTVCAACDPVTHELPDPNGITSFVPESMTVQLVKCESLQDMWDLWGTGTIKDTSSKVLKSALDMLAKDGWSDFSSEANVDADIIFFAEQQDGIVISYVIYIDAGTAVFYPYSNEYANLPRYSHKQLTADEISNIKQVAYYYFSEHLEN
ncbi:MAG: hypothetical protein IJK33_02705 [Clostridia bacterium]|nr:hypothetical protein [Clostridia bacterium]